jgi:hypothetical protein
MIYIIDEHKLLRLWSVIRCFTEMREISDPVIQSEILTNAQIILTAVVLDLEPIGWRSNQLCSAENQSRSDRDV